MPLLSTNKLLKDFLINLLTVIIINISKQTFCVQYCDLLTNINQNCIGISINHYFHLSIFILRLTKPKLLFRHWFLLRWCLTVSLHLGFSCEILSLSLGDYLEILVFTGKNPPFKGKLIALVLLELWMVNRRHNLFWVFALDIKIASRKSDAKSS